MGTNTSSDQPHVSLCCAPGLYLRNSSCYAEGSFPAPKIILPEIHYSNPSISSMSPEEFVPQYRVIDCFVNAVYNLHSDLAENVSIYLFENGTIYVNDSIKVDEAFGTEKYCLASQTTDNGTRSVVSVCLQPHNVNDSRDLKIGAILASLSIPFFVVIFAIYTIVPELRNISGNIFLCNIASLAVAYAIFVKRALDPACNYVITLIWQFTTLASPFWVNVMCFDIWWTFGAFGSLQCGTSQKDRGRYIIYSFDGWGVPALITGIGVIVDSLPGEWTGLIRPGLRGNCWFSSVAASEIYLFGPQAVTIVPNVLFFAHTAIKIKIQKRNTDQQLRNADSRRHDDKIKQRFNPYLRLWVVMGAPRLAQIFVVRYPSLPDYIWYTLALVDCFMGPIIFVIFVWNENTKKLLLKRLRLMDETIRQHMSSTTTTTPTTSTSTRPESTSEYTGRDEPTINRSIV